MLFLLTLTVCEVPFWENPAGNGSGYSTCRASVARYFAGCRCRLPSMRITLVQLENASMVAFYFTPLLPPMLTSSAKHDGATIICHRPDRQL